jgi:hypothetical protein
LDARDTIAVGDRLASLGLPARVVWGTADQFQKLDYGARLAADLGTTLTRIEGGSTSPPRTTPRSSRLRSTSCCPPGTP